MYTPWTGFTVEQAATLNRVEAFIARYGDSVDRIVLESLQTEYPDDGIHILEREHFWDVGYTLQTDRGWHKFHSRLGVSISPEDQNNQVRVYPIWASYPQCFDAPRESWYWSMNQLAQHLYRSKTINDNHLSKQQIDSLLSIQWRTRLIHDEMISQIQEKVRVLKSL